MCIPDNYDLFDSHQARQDKWLESRPECSECGEHIQEDCCYEINGEYICESCMKDNHRKWVDDIVV